MKRVTAGRGELGVTLVELIIVIAILGVVLAATYNMFSFQQKSYIIQDNVAVMQQNVRVGLAFMVREIRMAGYIPEGIPPYDAAPSVDVSSGDSEPVEEATANAITIQADVDDDQISETVRYVITGTDLTREVWEWNSGSSTWDATDGAQIVAENIESISFTYSGLMPNGLDDDSDGTVDNDDVGIFDINGNGIDDDSDGSTDEDGDLNTTALRADIRDITVSMTARAEATDANYTDPQQGDHYRRRTLTSSVCLRNML